MQNKTINGFTLQRLLGTGGMAEVWYAENEIHKRAAVKILNPELSHNETVVKRFRREAEIMVQLEHPNIRSAYSLGDLDGRPAMIMEYLEGTDLKKMLVENHRFTQEELMKWWNQLVDALNYAHNHDMKVVHRDIKPSNIFIDRKGNVKLLDFGVAKIKESIHVTMTGTTIGTLMYMSPEQADNAKVVTPASDSYSLAVTFVHLLTGKSPYSDTSSERAILNAIAEEPLDLSGVPKEWRKFLALYLAKKPEDRPVLRPFEAEVSEVSDKTDEFDDEGTILDVVSEKQEPKKSESKWVEKPEPKFEDESKNKKKGLWIGLGIVVAVMVALVLLLKPKQEPTPTDPDTQAYEACQTVADYRAYMSDYGRNALHYADANAFVEQYVADSIEQARQTHALADAGQKKEAEHQAQAEEEKKEESAYKKCTTISACENYLKSYPQGRYVAEVRKKKAVLEKEAEKLEQPPTTQPSGSAITVTANGVSFVMKRVAGGTFQMGSNDSEANSSEKPVHSVMVSSFYMGETEVTQALWKAVMGSNPSKWKGDNLPLENVSWNDCQEFIRKLNQLTDRSFRLPTEAEWEFAARGGNQSNGYKYAGSNNIGSVAWYTDNSGSKTHAVKGKSPNELGLYDMSGNVWEWCSDWFSSSYYSSSSSNNPKGPLSGSSRVLRGGCWFDGARGCRVSCRSCYGPGSRVINYGLRLCLPQ